MTMWLFADPVRWSSLPRLEDNRKHAGQYGPS